MVRGVSRRTAFLSGDEALAQGAYEEGLRLAASYPGTPATEILEYLAGLDGVEAQWSVNEKVAFEVALSASIAGARSMFSAKHVGLNVAMDPLVTSAYTGVGAGFVVVSCDDPGLHSSQNEQDNRLIARMAKVPLLEPSSPREAKDFMKEAFRISETFDIPVMVRLTTRVSHTKQDVMLGTRREVPLKAFGIDTAKYVMVPRNAYQRHIILEKKLQRLARCSNASRLNQIEPGSRKLGFITGGVSYLYAKEMYPDASFLKLGFSYPFPASKVKEFCAKVKKVVVLEELEPFLEEQVRALGIACRAKDPSFRVGELKPEYVPLVVAGRKKTREELWARKPLMCPGCPHRMVFSVLRKLKLTVTGDIGCYTLGAQPPLRSLHTCLCMGSGITFFEGFRRVLGRGVVGVIGDSTFVHSGISGLINLSYNGTKGVVVILDNGTTAMTGAQPHPATGMTAQGAKTKRLVLEELCASCGADHVDVVDPHDVKGLEALIQKRLGEDALSVVIARAPCMLVGAPRSSPPSYDPEKCKACYLCLSIDCPALKKSDEGRVVLDARICSGCNLCTEVCAPQALHRHA